MGHPWLKEHNPNVDWKSSVVSFDNCDHSEGEAQKVEVPRDLGSIYQDQVELPDPYKTFHAVFEPREADKLPPHHPYDLRIDLEEGKLPKMGPIYSLTWEEQEAQGWIDSNLKKGFIQPSTSSVGCPIMFMKRKDRSN